MGAIAGSLLSFPAPSLAVTQEDLRVLTVAEARANGDLSRAQAVALVQKRYAARVVRADFDEASGRRLYVFRLLSERGKVWTVRIDARSGIEVP